MDEPENCVRQGGLHCLHWPVGDDIDWVTGEVISYGRSTVYCCKCDIEAWTAWKDGHG